MAFPPDPVEIIEDKLIDRPDASFAMWFFPRAERTTPSGLIVVSESAEDDG